jgi:hypothetical protein
MKITIDVMSGMGSPGYIPINIEITNLGEDRAIDITAQSQGFYTYGAMMGYYGGEPRAGSVDLRQTIRLRKGDRQRVTMPLPVAADNENVQLQIREGGRILHRVPFSFQTVSLPDYAPALIVANPASSFGVIARDLPRTSLPTPPSASGIPPGMPGSPPAISGKGPFDITREPERLPVNWLGYTTLRAVFIGKQEWGELSAAQKDALLAWTASGGDLSFVDGDLPTLFPEPQRRPSAIGSGEGSERYFLGQIFFSHAEDLTTKGLQLTLQEMRVAGPNGQRAASPRHLVISDPEASSLRSKAEQMRPADNYSSWRLPIPSALDMASNPMIPPRYWAGGQEGFGFKLPIPGTGGVSTRVYLGILALFTLLIGPVNFWILKRRRQQVLMVLTTPLVSLVFIGLLAGYAIAGQGFGISGRAETFTFLDQSSKQAATRATVSLYAAGMAPWGGTQFSRDSLIFPTGPLGMPHAGQKSLDLTEGQHYSGLLQARAPANFDQVSFRTARERLTFSAAGADIEVLNGLGGNVQQLFYRDKGQVYSLAEPLASGGRGKLTRGAAAPVLEKALRSSVPNTPLALVPERSDKFQHFFLDSLADGAFYAILDRSPFWEPGVTAIDERASFHVVAGYAGGEL